MKNTEPVTQECASVIVEKVTDEDKWAPKQCSECYERANSPYYQFTLRLLSPADPAEIVAEWKPIDYIYICHKCFSEITGIKE